MFVKQLVHELLLFDGNSILCVHYEISIRFLIISKEHILKEMTELGMSASLWKSISHLISMSE
jgi:hypothetical protein